METNTELEICTTTETIEVRAGEKDQPTKIVGYAAVYNSLSADLGGFQERILFGAFAGSVNGKTDIRALMDHDNTKLLGRISSGTLKVSEDTKGLRVEITLPDTSYAADLRALITRGDVKGMSFGFKTPEGGQRFTNENGTAIREITNVDLREVSVISSTPAYGATSLQLRVDPSVMQHLNSKTYPHLLCLDPRKQPALSAYGACRLCEKADSSISELSGG